MKKNFYFIKLITVCCLISISFIHIVKADDLFRIEEINSSTYCIYVYLSKGAVLKPFVGNAVDASVGKYEELTVKQFSSKKELTDAILLVSGTFHDDAGKPSFPIKIDGNIATYGFERNIEGNPMLMIRNSEKRAYIGKYNRSNFEGDSIAPDVVVGLDKYYNKRPSDYTGRNYVGLKDPYNNAYGTVVFLVSSSLTQMKAREFLKNRGCPLDQIMQLDGSSTSQFSHKTYGSWTHQISTGRQMPQIFAVFSGNSSSCSAGKIMDCNNKCVSELTVNRWLGDGVCDQYSYFDINCSKFNYDNGDCDN